MSVAAAPVSQEFSATGSQEILPLTNDSFKSAEIGLLLKRSLWPNPFYQPSYLEGSLLLKEFGSASAVYARNAADALIGFLPVRRMGLLEGGFLGVLKAYRTPYISRSEPLLDADCAEEAMTGLLQALCDGRTGDRLFLFPMLDLDGPVAGALASAAKALDRKMLVLNSHERAALKLGDRLQNDRFKNARRLLRRMQEAGKLEVRLNQRGKAASGLLDIFLEIEASGWKGKKGTALAANPATKAFARAAFDPDKTDVAFDLLLLDDKPIAANLNLFSQNEVMALKSGYDEAFRNLSPGVVLDFLLSEAAVRGEHGLLIDSCATPGHHLEKLWPSRLRMGSILIDCSPTPSPRHFGLRAAMLSQFLRMREAAKDSLRRWVL